MSAAENAGGWPDPTKPGTPLNPERDGTHWLWISQATGALMAFQWHAPPGPDRVGAWINISRNITTSHPLDAVRMGLTYCAPCLTPSEIAAREAAAALAMKEAAAALIECGCKNRNEVVMQRPNSAARWNLCEHPNCMMIEAAAIRSLPLPAAAQAALDSEVLAATDNPEINDIMARGAIYDR